MFRLHRRAATNLHMQCMLYCARSTLFLISAFVRSITTTLQSTHISEDDEGVLDMQDGLGVL